MTSAAADGINHNGRKIGRFKSIRFCYARMTSAQSWSRRHHWFEPTSSFPIFKGLYLVIYKTLARIFSVRLKECWELYLCKNPIRNMHVYPTKSSRFQSTDFASVMIDDVGWRRLNVYPIKSSRFQSTDFASVMIDDVGCSRRHQCPRCDEGLTWNLSRTCGDKLTIHPYKWETINLQILAWVW